MEIISYVGGSAAVRRRRLLPLKLAVPKIKIFSKKKSSFQPKKERQANKIYPRLLLKKIGAYFWTLPLVALIFLIPLGANKALTMLQSRANPLVLKDDALNELEFLNQAMSRFALSTGSAIDDDGNISGAAAKSAFHEKISYQNYTVKSGDTIGGIAIKFGLRNISTIIAVNNIENVRRLYSGQKLVIPSFDGLIYTVATGNSLQGISAKYDCPVEDILDANDLDSMELSAGQKLFIPGAKLDRDTLRRAMGETWAVPLKAKWRLTSTCGWRGDPFTGVKQYHPGIDMACPTGTPIYAALGGKVLASGMNRIYGNYIIIDHGNGYQTLYGHMSKRISAAGDYVQQGQKIGLVGSTGYSTGSHLHWTVYKNGKVVDPLTLIK